MESNIIYSVTEFRTIKFNSINYRYSRRIYRLVILYRFKQLWTLHNVPKCRLNGIKDYRKLVSNVRLT